MPKFKRTIIAVTASGLILFSAAGKSEAIPAPLQNIWDATIGRIASSFTNISNQYLGALIEEYLPRGFEAVTGALGLPDPSSLFDSIRDKIASGDRSDIDDNRFEDMPVSVWGEVKINEIGESIAQTLGEGFFSEEVQEVNAQANESINRAVQGSSEDRERADGLEVTQDILKEIAKQNEKAIAVSAATVQKLDQQAQQTAGANFALSRLAKEANDKERGEISESQRKAQSFAGNASFVGGFLNKGQ